MILEERNNFYGIWSFFLKKKEDEEEEINYAKSAEIW